MDGSVRTLHIHTSKPAAVGAPKSNAPARTPPRLHQGPRHGPGSRPTRAAGPRRAWPRSAGAACVRAGAPPTPPQRRRCDAAQQRRARLRVEALPTRPRCGARATMLSRARDRLEQLIQDLEVGRGGRAGCIPRCPCAHALAPPHSSGAAATTAGTAARVPLPPLSEQDGEPGDNPLERALASPLSLSESSSAAPAPDAVTSAAAGGRGAASSSDDEDTGGGRDDVGRRGAGGGGGSGSPLRGLSRADLEQKVRRMGRWASELCRVAARTHQTTCVSA
jgi:hypothetical protein